MKNSSTIYKYWIPVMILAGILFSCVNDLDTIQKVTYDPKAPNETSTNLEVLYTDSGYARVKIFAKLAETYSSPEKVTKFKDGVEVDFFSEEGDIVSKLTALYGEVNFKSGLITVRDSVVLRNLKKKQYMETEELFYNQVNDTISTEKYVICKKDGKGVIGRGHGLKTTRFFNYFEILAPEGKMDFSED
ncbi:MAG: LPS export ABC transporter periplasmic protein LptC [Crocinitomicaceae bacterium]|nr:LPS export ABC transporter periplasmic protein LptC [Crocinitomicaceae bacterium]